MFLFGALFACGADLGEPGVTSKAAQGEISCSDFLCMDNTGTMGGLPFFELDAKSVDASPNGGFRMDGFSHPAWGTMAVDVGPGVSLAAHTLGGLDGIKRRTGTELIHSVLRVHSVAGGALRTFEVEITALHRALWYWEGPKPPLIESYTMMVKETTNGVNTQAVPLCPKAKTSAMVPAGTEIDAIVFGLERYDPATASVTATGAAAGSWFNIACSGDVLAKMILIQHATAAQDLGHVTTVAQRDAGLKMFIADYCGTGTPNTELGTPLDWQNAGGWNHLDKAATLQNIEAIWTDHGAACLGNPRRPELIVDHCLLPQCTANHIANWKSYGSFITINPYFQTL